MGNAIPRTNIVPGDTNVLYVLTSTDNENAYFSFAFFRNLMESKPAFIVTIGADSNTAIKVDRMDEITGSVLDTIKIANNSITTKNNQYSFDICGQTLMITENNVPIATFVNPDLQYMSLYQGGGSSGTMIITAAPMQSLNKSCNASESMIPLDSIMSTSFQNFPWWGILLIVIAALIIFGALAWLLYKMITSLKNNKTSRQNKVIG